MKRDVDRTRAPAGPATGAANLVWARALLEGLVAGGVRHVVVSPGSRSSPVVLALHGDERLVKHVQIDERSAAFVALGIAKATCAPVALLCTSGTAAANYLPALAEATLAGAALVALTADRPPELRGAGAAQTIDQIGLYGRHVRHFVDLPCPGDAAADPRQAARLAAEACAVARDGAMGPVHLNLPLREPLVPSADELHALQAEWLAIADAVREAGRAGAESAAATPTPDERLAAIAARIGCAQRPLLMAGPEAVDGADAAAVLALARAAGMPVFADIASGLRAAADPDVPVCALADLMLRDEALAAIAPDFVLRLGGIPTSKVVATWLVRHRPEVVAVQPDRRRRDPDGVIDEVVVGRPSAICAALARQLPDKSKNERGWSRWLVDADRAARALSGRAPHEAAAVVAACAAMPSGANLFLSSSMPIRWAETYVGALAPQTAVFVNRGANGIDGIVSSAVGVAIGSRRPTLLVAGDLAFLHDAGGLRSARDLVTPFVVLLLDNDGGGIFSHLPIAEHEGAFEAYFGTPQGCDLAAIARASGIEAVETQTADEVAGWVGRTLREGGVRVVRWRSDRARTLAEQRALTRVPSLHLDRVHAGGLDWAVRQRGLGPRTLLLLHGFSGSGESWQAVALALPGWRCVMPDLPGHGGSDAPLPGWRLDAAADALATLLDVLGIERCALAGYSMGGRLALALALRHPTRFEALALIGASPGIADAAERAARAAADDELAASIERDGIEAFTDRWQALPLFASQRSLAPEQRAALRAQRLAQDPARLAAALRAFGTGAQPPLHERVPTLAMPVLWIAGALDTRFAAIAETMAAGRPQARACIVADAGHAVAFERPLACAAELERFFEAGG